MHPDRSSSAQALLCALLLGLLALSVVPEPGTGNPAAPRLSDPTIPADSVSIRLRRGGPEDTRDSPLLQDVRDLLEGPLLRLDPKASRVDATREALVGEYGSLVTETPIELAYLFVWTGEHWIVVCMGGAAFEIDLGTDGVVLVEARDGMIL